MKTCNNGIYNHGFRGHPSTISSSKQTSGSGYAVVAVRNGENVGSGGSHARLQWTEVSRVLKIKIDEDGNAAAAGRQQAGCPVEAVLRLWRGRDINIWSVREYDDGDESLG